jgi:polyhydroxybutyrate depolymerase
MFHAFVRAGLLLAALLPACTSDADLPPSAFTYPPGKAPACAQGSRRGGGGTTTREKTEKGIAYLVRTPSNYDPTFAHPLLMVYPPAGLSAKANERHTGFTALATRLGFVVTYAGHVRASVPVMKELATIPGDVAKKWCIDEQRIYLTGHSDGGTAATAIALFPETRDIPAAIAPSAAGFTRRDLEEFGCPAPLDVLIAHSADDRHFRGFGAQAAAWWSGCNRCQAAAQPLGETGCVAYPNCGDGVKTVYCEVRGPHGRWPNLNRIMLTFFGAP